MNPPTSPTVELGPIADEALISRSAAMMTTEVAGEVVMMSIDKGVYFGLDEIGSDVWRRLETPRTFAELVGGLSADYSGEPVQIASDVRQLLRKMILSGVLTVA